MWWWLRRTAFADPAADPTLSQEPPQPAAQPGPQKKSTEFQAKFIENRAMALGRQIRCVVCAGQSIEESATDFAILIRTVVRQKMHEGLTDDEVLKFLAQTYGDEVLFSGGLNMNHVAIAGMATLLVGAAAVAYRQRRLQQLSHLSVDMTSSSLQGTGSTSTVATPRVSILDRVSRALGVGVHRWPSLSNKQMDNLLSMHMYIQPVEVRSFHDIMTIPSRREHRKQKLARDGVTKAL